MKAKWSLLVLVCIMLGMRGGVACTADSGEGAKGTSKVAAKVKAPTEITWLNYEEGIAKAKKEGKHVLIDFYTSWCGWCKKMDKSTFRDKSVVRLVSDKMVAIKIDAESKKFTSHDGKRMTERELSLRVYGARSYPTYGFVNPKGEFLFPARGYRKAPEFLELLEFVSGEHYKAGSFSTFIEGKKKIKKP